MEAIRFDFDASGRPNYYFCNNIVPEGEFYHKSEADAEIAVLNADLTRCQEAKTAIGDKCLRLEAEVERLRTALKQIVKNNNAGNSAAIAKQALEGR